MTRIQQMIFSWNSFTTGLMVPVLTLILLDRGATLETLPLLLGVYSLTVLCLELPSGMLADMIGRKSVFLLSCVFQTISMLLIVRSGNVISLLLSMLFSGFGRAFSSGSLDALFIDQAMELHGKEYLAKVTSRLAVLEGGGLASGCILGGFIADLDKTYTGNIVLRLFLTAVLFILVLAFVKEQPLHDKKEQQPASFLELIRQGKQALLSTPIFGLVLIGVFFIGYLLFSVETYWQPAFLKITAAREHAWLLGLITFVGFLTVILGNTLVRKLLDRPKISDLAVYTVCRALMAAVVLVFALQKNAPGFVFWFAGIYLFLGAGNVAESTWINKNTPSGIRASMLSLNSLVLQTGGLVSSLVSSFLISRLDFSGIWFVAGILLGIFAAVMAFAQRAAAREKLLPGK